MMIHRSRRLLIRVVQQLLRLLLLALLNADVWLLLIGVVRLRIVEARLGHITTSSFGGDLQGHIVGVRGLCSSGRVELTLALLRTCNDIAEILRVLALTRLGRVN